MSYVASRAAKGDISSTFGVPVWRIRMATDFSWEGVSFLRTGGGIGAELFNDRHNRDPISGLGCWPIPTSVHGRERGYWR